MFPYGVRNAHTLSGEPDLPCRAREISTCIVLEKFEMNAKELFETTMNPERRKFLKVDLNDQNTVEADRMFTILMGDVVEPRRQFIEDNALNVRNLDV